jgi:hypothetical protein
MTYVERAHTWLADHFRWVQYPRVSPFQRRFPFFETAMPWPLRVGLVLFGVIALAICAIALFFLGLLTWAAITA